MKMYFVHIYIYIYTHTHTHTQNGEYLYIFRQWRKVHTTNTLRISQKIHEKIRKK